MGRVVAESFAQRFEALFNFILRTQKDLTLFAKRAQSLRDTMSSRCALRSLRVTTAVVFGYLCAGELLPLPVLKASHRVLKGWQRQQVILLSVLSCFPLLLSRASRKIGYSYTGRDSNISALWIFAAVNIIPIMAAAVTTHWLLLSDNCPLFLEKDCKYMSTLLDVIGLVTSRLARLNLGISLLLAARGKSTWLFGMTGGLLGFSETIPLHRAAGWWCVAQSAIHSIAYVSFYLHEGGMQSLRDYCFPVPLPDKLNRLGLVNMFGLLGCLAALAIALPALPWVRCRYYQIFQRLHLPVAALFVLCCALHDLPILLFAAPGLADWYFGWREPCVRRRLPARARVLHGTSGPWVELTVDCDEIIASTALGNQAPRGQWVWMRVLPLGREYHPLSVAHISTSSSEGKSEVKLSMIVSSKAGNWSGALVNLANKDHQNTSTFEAEVSGPYPCGGRWSLLDSEVKGLKKVVNRAGNDHKEFLLLLAGGTGITGWLQALRVASDGSVSGHRRCRIVWCVQTEADYLALAGWLPCHQILDKKQENSRFNWDQAERKKLFDVTVFITRCGARDASVSAMKFMNMSVQNPVFMTEAHKKGRSDCNIGDKSFIPSINTPSGVSFASAIIGIFVQQFIWWDWLAHDTVGLPQTLTGLALKKRALPIALIIGCMVLTTVLSPCIIKMARSVALCLHQQKWFRVLIWRELSYEKVGNDDDKNYVYYDNDEEKGIFAGSHSPTEDERLSGTIELKELQLHEGPKQHKPEQLSYLYPNEDILERRQKAKRFRGIRW